MNKTIKLENLTGERFNRLLVLRLAYRKNSFNYYECSCDCGNKKIIRYDGLKTGHTKSCGCYKRETSANNGKKSKTHGHSINKKVSFIYRTWQRMKARCFNPNNNRYKYYGKRGILVCDKWKNSFEKFLNDVGEPPSKNYTIDRIDNNGNYTPENVKWSTKIEQANNKSSNVKLTINGITKNLTQWSKISGIKRQTLSGRLKRGWSPEKVITNPFNLTINGVTKTLKQWSLYTGIKYSTLHRRLNYGWNLEKSIITPVKKYNNVKNSSI